MLCTYYVFFIYIFHLCISWWLYIQKSLHKPKYFSLHFSEYLFELIFVDDIRVQFYSSTCGYPVYALTSLSKVVMDLTLGSLLHFIDLCITFTLLLQYLIIKTLWFIVKPDNMFFGILKVMLETVSGFIRWGEVFYIVFWDCSMFQCFK